MTYQDILDNLINDIVYNDELTTLEIINNIKELMLNYGKYNAEKCLKDKALTGSCITDSQFILNKFLEIDI